MSRVECWFAAGQGNQVKLHVLPNAPLPMRLICDRLGVYMPTVTMGFDTLDELWRVDPAWGTEEFPVRIPGFLGPFDDGQKGRILLCNSCEYDGGRCFVYHGGDEVDFEFISLLQLTNLHAVHLVRISGVEQEVVMKIDYDNCGGNSCAFDVFNTLKKKGVFCPSLADIFAKGYIRVPDRAASSQPIGITMLPKGDPLNGRYGGKDLCKAAFDIFLGLFQLFHLHSAGFRHMNVNVGNIIVTERQGGKQFVLIGFSKAQYEEYSDVDVVGLVCCLAEMCLGVGKPVSLSRAVPALSRENPDLGEFACEVFEKRQERPQLGCGVVLWTDYPPWLQRFAAACGIHLDRAHQLMQPSVGSLLDRFRG